MARTALTDGSGRWFDPTKSQSWEEGTYWNGNNPISMVTGSQWNHEQLYRTKGGRWILHGWSQWQGSTDSWAEITNETAARWLVRNECEPHEACAAEFAELEIQ